MYVLSSSNERIRILYCTISNQPSNNSTNICSSALANPMDVEDEWELLSDQDDGFLEINDDNQIYSRNKSSAAVFHMNYFICPQFVEHTTPITTIDHHPKLPVQIKIDDPIQDPVSQVFFKKTEFVDIKVDSPKIEANFQIEAANFQFQESKGESETDSDMAMEVEGKQGGEGGGKWNFGAICSLGVAAATFCIIVFTNNKHHKLHFRIYNYSDDKRMKAIAAVSGVPITRARITVGGYYDASLSVSVSVSGNQTNKKI